MGPTSVEPARNCALCPRLCDFRADNDARYPTWWNAPVPSFGPLTARFLVTGLAPGLKGANRTGRPFTGDDAGNLLYPTLTQFNFADGIYGERPDDGLTLKDCRITNAVRCVPPENRPKGEEINACRAFLMAEIAAMKNLKVILALGRISHDSLLRGFGLKLKEFPFVHGALHPLDDQGGLVLADSYHCSRYNTNTGRLTPEMFRDVFIKISRILA